MKIEPRNTFGTVSIVLVCENEQESAILDTLGNSFANSEVPAVKGAIRLSDGYGEHYISLEADGRVPEDGAHYGHAAVSAMTVAAKAAEDAVELEGQAMTTETELKALARQDADQYVRENGCHGFDNDEGQDFFRLVESFYEKRKRETFPEKSCAICAASTERELKQAMVDMVANRSYYNNKINELERRVADLESILDQQ